MMAGERRLFSFSFVICLISTLFSAACGQPFNNGSGNHSHHEKVSNSTIPGWDTDNPYFWRYTVIVVSVTILLLIAAVFDLGKEFLEDICDEEFEKVLGKMFGELALLGFIGLIMFFVDKKTTLLEQISENLFGNEFTDGEEDEAGKIVSELFEQVHMLLFLVMILYMCFVLLLIFAGRRTLKQWEANEKLAETGARDIIRRFDMWRKVNPTHPFYDLWHIYSPSQQLLQMRFLLKRERFIQNLEYLHTQELRGLPAHQFNFAMYLRLQYLEFLAETVDIPSYLWLVIITLIVVFYFLKLYLSMFVLSFLYIGVSWATVVFCFLVLHKLESIVDHLIPTTYSKHKKRKNHHRGSTGLLKGISKPLLEEWEDSAKGDIENGTYGSNGTGKEKKPKIKKKKKLRRQSSTFVVRNALQKNMHLPRYWTSEIKRPGCITSCFEYLYPMISDQSRDVPPNKHERLFWFSYKGKRFLMDFLCCAMILNSMFVAIFFSQFLYLENASESKLFFFLSIILAVIPVFLQAGLLPYITDNTIISTSIEQMIEKEFVSEVAVKCKTVRLFRTLLLYEIMSAYAKSVMKENGGTGLPSSNLTARQIYTDDQEYSTKRQYLRDMFNEMDKDGSYDIGINEFCTLVKDRLHIVSTTEQAKNWFKKIDEDNSGSLEFDELFDAWAQLDHSKDPTPNEVEEVATQLFKQIDSDESGCITADEFREKLTELSLGEGMSTEDLSAIIQEIDEDNNNRIELHEFIDYVMQILDAK